MDKGVPPREPTAPELCRRSRTWHNFRKPWERQEIGREVAEHSLCSGAAIRPPWMRTDGAKRGRRRLVNASCTSREAFAVSGKVVCSSALVSHETAQRGPPSATPVHQGWARWCEGDPGRPTLRRSVPQLTQRLPLLLRKEMLVAPPHLLGLMAREVVEDAVICASPGDAAAERAAAQVEARLLRPAVLTERSRSATPASRGKLAAPQGEPGADGVSPAGPVASCARTGVAAPAASRGPWQHRRGAGTRGGLPCPLQQRDETPRRRFGTSQSRSRAQRLPGGHSWPSLRRERPCSSPRE
jgi:hypothetical protein